MHNLTELFLKNLAFHMEDKGLNKTDLAQKMKVSLPSLFPYFKGESAPGLEKLSKFADALGVDPFELIKPDQPKKSPTIASLSKIIDEQESLINGNEEMLGLWNKLDEETKDFLMKQMRNLSHAEVKSKSKA